MITKTLIENNVLIPVINCGKPEIPTGSELIGDRFTVNSLVQFKCKPGHKMIDGDGTLVCSSKAEWQGIQPVCKCKYYLFYKTFKLKKNRITHQVNFTCF